MPELPEVQTVVNNLNPVLCGKSIKSVSNPNGYQNVFENGSLTYYNSFLKNKIINNIYRRGKYIIFKLNSGYAIVHLRMTGKLVVKQPNEKNMKYVSFKLSLSNNKKLFFEDIRKFGRIYINKNIHWLENKIGIEPLSDKFTSTFLYKILNDHRRMIKPLLLDQKYIAGLGNIYVDEALWDSGIHPQTLSNNITRKKTQSLSISIKKILTKAISYQGTTIINFSYGQNQAGNFSEELQIFGKNNSPCPKCESIIKKIFVSQRGTHYCKNCQKY